MENPIKYSDLVQPDGSIEQLIRQLNELRSTYSSSISDIKSQANGLAESLKNVNGATTEGRQATKEAATEVDRLREQHKKLAEAEEGTHKELMRLKDATKEANKLTQLETKLANSKEGSYNRLSAQYSLNKIRLNAMSDAERRATREGQQLERETRAIYEQMKKLQEATGKHQLNVGNYYQGMQQAMAGYGQQLTSMVTGNNMFLQSLVSLGGGMKGTTSIMGGLSAGLKALGSTLMSLMANPVFLAVAGVTAIGAGIKWWYDYNSGIQEATKLTREFTGMAGEELQLFRSEVLAIANTWGHDYKETLQAVDSVASNFKISFQEAAEAIKDGFVAGADLNGDFLSKLGQYPAYFKEAGLSARQFIAIVTQTRSGIFGDAGLDAIKQANARIRQMTDQTAGALNSIGINANKVQEDLVSGSRNTFDVLQEVSAKLSELPPASQEVGEVLVNVFGKQGRDAGLEMIKSLQDISTNLDEVKAQTGELGQLEEEQMKAEKEYQTALAALFDMTGGNFEKMKSSVSLFIKRGLTSLIKGIIDLANYIIEAYNKSATFRAIWNGIQFVFKSTFAFIGNLFTAFIDTLKGIGKMVVGIFSFDFDEIADGFEKAAFAIPKMIHAQAKDMSRYLDDAVKAQNSRMTPIKIPVELDDGTGGTGSQSSGSSTAQTRRSVVPSSAVKSTPKSTAARAAKTAKGRVKTQTQDPNQQHDRTIDAGYRADRARIEAQRKAEDEALKMENDSLAKRLKVIDLHYKREITDIQSFINIKRQMRMADNRLSAEEEQAYYDQIHALQAQWTQAQMDASKQYDIDQLQQQKEAIDLKLKSVREGTTEELRLRMEALEKEREIALLRNELLDPANAQSATDINASYDALAQEINDKFMQANLERFDKEQELAQSEFDLMEQSERAKTRYRLKAEKERLERILDLNLAMGKKMSDVEVQTIMNQIQKINKDIDNEAPKDIYDTLGFNLSDEKKQAIDQSLQYANEALNSFMDSYVKAAEAREQLAQKQVDSAKSTLEAEIEARNKGYASDVAGAQRELDLARKTQEKARRQAEKAQKAQALIQAAEQAGNLVTASSLIWSQLGFPWAIPALAVMWGSFAYSKIKAVQAVGKSEEYGEGTVELLSGGSHQSGNDVDLGTKSDGTKRRAEGGEFFAVINKRNSRRFRKQIPDVIRSLNDGTFGAKYMNAYKTDDGLVVNVSGSPEELRMMATDVSAIRRAQERKVYTDANGNTIEQYKNLRKTTRR